MSFSLFNENTRRYGVHLLETSELMVETQHMFRAYGGERVRCTIRFVIHEKIACLEATPEHSLSRAILSYRQGLTQENEVYDAEGRLWIVQGYTVNMRMGQPGVCEGSIELTAPMPMEIDPSLLESIEIKEPSQPCNNLLREEGKWKIK